MGHLHTPSDAPLLAPETIAYAKECIVLFGLQEWDIWLCDHDMPDGSSENAGVTNLDMPYLRADITLMRGLTPERIRSVLRHEMLHIALAFIQQTVGYITAMLSKVERKRAQAMYRDVEEQTIERLVRAMETLIDPPPAEQ